MKSNKIAWFLIWVMLQIIEILQEHLRQTESRLIHLRRHNNSSWMGNCLPLCEWKKHRKVNENETVSSGIEGLIGHSGRFKLASFDSSAASSSPQPAVMMKGLAYSDGTRIIRLWVKFNSWLESSIIILLEKGERPPCVLYLTAIAKVT